ncbi:TPA: DUF1361 domain-containing protein [Streptococcus suis]
MFSPKNLLIHLFFALICIGLFLNGSSEATSFWNMVWALLALDFSLLVRQNNHFASKLLITPFWLFFYPNTFYILTELVNIPLNSLSFTDSSSFVPAGLSILCVLFGIMAGVESVESIIKGFNISFYGLRLLMITSLSFVSSYSIYIGKLYGLTSWDIFTQPLVVLNAMFSAVTWDTFPFILGFSFIQIMVLVFAVDE